MATFHVIYDPTDRVQPPSAGRWPDEIKFAVLKRDAPPARDEIIHTAFELTELLMKQLVD